MRCALCHGDLEADAGRCDGCGTRLHLDCARAAGTCPTLGCGRAWAPVKAHLAGPPRPTSWRAALALVAVFGCSLWSAMTPFYPARWDEDANRRGLEAFLRARAAQSAPVVTASQPPPRLPGRAVPEDVLAACRALLDDPASHGARLGPDQVASLAPALVTLEPALVVVERAAVVVDLGQGRGLVALSAGGTRSQAQALAGTQAYTLEKVVEGLWLYTRWW